MFKKIIFNIFLIFFFTTVLIASQSINIESTGISVIKDESASYRQNALKDAFRKAIKKVLVEILNLSDNETFSNILANPEKYINGYEIIEEKQIGNILNEKIKANINLFLLEKAVHKRSLTQLLYIAIYCQNDNNTQIDKDCVDFIKKIIRGIPNTIFLPYQSTIEKSFSEEKDLFVNINYKVTEEKKIYSISREFDNVSIDLKCFNRNNMQVFHKMYNVKILRGFNETVFDKLGDTILNSVKRDIVAVIDKLTEEKKIFSNNNQEYYLVLETPRNFNDVKNVVNLLKRFSVNYSLVEISNHKFIYLIKGKSKNDILKIFRFAKFQYQFIRSENNVTIGF